ncbi:UNVERIFIED_CONTAM: hypothetical protein FKN15_011671 [Acipenser sinensis]
MLLPPPSPGDYMLLPPSLAGAEQQELPLPPSPPGGEEQELPLPSPEGPGREAGDPQQPLHRLLREAWGRTARPQWPQKRPKPTPQLVLTPAPPKDACLAPPKDASLASPKDACFASPGAACYSASQQEVLWLEPHYAELPAMKKVGEVRRPAPTTAVSLPEIVGEVRRPAPTAALSLPEIVGEVRKPAPTIALSLQEVLWPEPHHAELPATKKGEVGGPPAPAAFLLPGLPQLKESAWELSAVMLTALPVAAWLLAALPPVGPLKSPFPARDFVLDCWIFKGGGGR